MKLTPVILALHVTAAVCHSAKAGLRAGGKAVKDTTPLVAEADKLIHLLVQDIQEPVEDATDHVEESVQQDVDNVKGVAKGKDPKIVPNVPDGVEKTVETDVKRVKKAADEVEVKPTNGKLPGARKTMKKKKQKPVKKEEEELPGLKNFLPKCLAHTTAILQQIDKSYTDMQLKTVLQNECKLSKEFPATYDDGFKSHDSCMAFADSLTEARFKELADGSTKGYTKFCEKFYELEADKKGKGKKGKDESGANALSVTGLVVLAVAIALWN